MEILFEDRDLIVAVKPCDLVSESTEKGDGFADLLTAHTGGGYIGVVHRLDHGVGGVMVYAKTPRAAAALSEQIRTRRFEKEYLALVHGEVQKKCDTLRDLLFHDRIRNKTYVVDRERRGVKEAILDYVLVERRESPEFGVHSLLRVTLHTGRTHQIRVQLASRAHPLLGDGKYGASGDRCPIGLFCHRIGFLHPVTGKHVEFTKEWDR